MLNMHTQLLEPDQISHTQSTVAKRGRTIHVKKFKTQCGRLQSIQQFWLQLDIVS